MSLKYTIAGTFTEQFELWDFPFDEQKLHLCVSSVIPIEALDFQFMPGEWCDDVYTHTV